MTMDQRISRDLLLHLEESIQKRRTELTQQCVLDSGTTCQPNKWQVAAHNLLPIDKHTIKAPILTFILDSVAKIFSH